MLPKTIYHYCTNTTLSSILEHGKIRLSPMLLSNDYLEGQHALSTIKRILKHRDFSSFEKEAVIEVLEFNSYQPFMSFGLCFSRIEDQLSQWRGYAKDGTGVSIGFNTERLLECLKESKIEALNSAKLVEVDYIDPIGYHLFGEFLSSLVGKVRPLKESWDAEKNSGMPFSYWIRRKLKINDHQEITENCFSVKGDGFAEEEEVRLLAFAPSHFDCGYHAHDDRITPFLELNLPKNKEVSDRVIESVTLGPKNRTDKEVASLMMPALGYPFVDINDSQISYC